MILKSYTLYSNSVDLNLQNGATLRLFFNEWTGKILFRWKINTISNVKHPGVILGYDRNGIWYYIHNHYQNGCPAIEPQDKFSKGQSVYLAELQSQYNQLQIIKNGLQEVLAAQPYTAFENNCQSFVNRICFGENKSEAVNNWVGGIAVGFLLLAGITVYNNNK